jgi:leader peptidase (prepilin peptidase)/N-methyltransferase
MANALWAVLAGVLGLAIGSFLNVVIYRVPAGLSVVHPPSACPKCGNEIRNRHNMPVLGWLMLRGRCYDCSEPISPRYPIVEALTGVVFAGAAAWLLHEDRAWLLPATLYMVAFCIVAALIAYDGQKLPTKLVTPSFAVLWALLLLAAALTPDWWGLARAGIATVALAVLSLVIRRGREPSTQDARELAQLVAAPLAFLSGGTVGYAAVLAIVLASALRRPRSGALVIAVAAAAVVAVSIPVP